jgi:hypothetical protein
MSLPRPLDNNNKHTLNLTYDCPDKVDHLSVSELDPTFRASHRE